MEKYVFYYVFNYGMLISELLLVILRSLLLDKYELYIYIYIMIYHPALRLKQSFSLNLIFSHCFINNTRLLLSSTLQTGKRCRVEGVCPN